MRTLKGFATWLHEKQYTWQFFVNISGKTLSVHSVQGVFKLGLGVGIPRLHPPL